MKGYFRKRGEKWSFTVDIGRDPVTGKRRQITRSGFASEKEARIACAQVIADFERGEVVNPSNETLKSFLLDYLENVFSKEVAPNTYQSRRAFAEHHIIPIIGHKKMSKLTPMDIQRLYNQLAEEGYSPGHIANIGVFLGKALNTAEQWGIIKKNVVKLVKKPGYKQKKIQVWTKEEVNKFLNATRESKYYPFYLLALTTGMRKGEILALQWKHVDFQKALIRVEQTVVYANRNLYIKPSPKTSSSVRNITIPPFVVKFLREYKLRQPPNELDLVVPDSQGRLMYPSVLDKGYAHDLKKVDVPPIRIHDMRHTHATLLLLDGENIKVVSERLGHAKVTTTMNTYAHLLPNLQKSAAERIEKMFDISI